ncbi:MAG: alpha/beta hydrolase family protein [Candidatus Thorarchaeota archaeon]
MTRRVFIFALVVMTIFLGSVTAMLFSIGSNYPERFASVPSEEVYDTSFWNLTSATTSPVNVNNHSSVSNTVGYQNTSVSINEWYFDYVSEVYKGAEVKINSVILSEQNLTSPKPTILYLHGYGEKYSDYLPMLREFAAAGFIVMGIDQPGSGNSTGYPLLSPFTFLNVTSGPEDASLFHSVLAAARAVTLLESLPFVRTDALIVAGNSMGGLVTFILSGIDSRVDGSIPMIAAGNFLNSIISGSLINLVIVPTYTIDSPEMHNIIKWFDPLAYTSLLSNPVLMMFGTNDQFFPIASLMDTIDTIQVELTLDIVPNWGHEVNPHWAHNIIRWIDNHFGDGAPLPRPQLSINDVLTLQGSIIKTDAEAMDTHLVLLYWRSSEPGAVWLYTELKSDSTVSSTIYSGEIVPLTIGKVLFFVVTVQEDSTRTSSGVFVRRAGSFLFPALLILSSIGILLVVHLHMWQPGRIHLVREIPYIIGTLTLSSGFILPFAIIEGRTSISLVEFIELYGESFLLSGWFLPSVLAGICFVLSLSAFRHRFQFRSALLVWLPILAITIILFVIFSGVFVIAGDIFSIRTGVGAITLIAAIPLMQVLDRLFRHRLTKLAP